MPDTFALLDEIDATLSAVEQNPGGQPELTSILRDLYTVVRQLAEETLPKPIADLP